MAAETGFLIEGTIYEPPSIDSFTMDENYVLWEYTGFGQEDFATPKTDEEREQLNERFRHPYLFTAFAHIAYQREHPELKKDRVRALLGGVNRAEMLDTLVADDPKPEEQPVPLDMTSGRSESSSSDSNENEPSKSSSSETSGNDSATGSDARASSLVRIGTGR